MATLSKTELDGQTKLEEELERLKRTLNRGFDLKVKWVPNGSDKLSGKVRGNTILIYDENIETALETLKHEFVDYSVCQVIEPYVEVTNRLVALLNDRAYKQKEKLVESFIKLL